MAYLNIVSKDIFGSYERKEGSHKRNVRGLEGFILISFVSVK